MALGMQKKKKKFMKYRELRIRSECLMITLCDFLALQTTPARLQDVREGGVGGPRFVLPSAGRRHLQPDSSRIYQINR